MKFIRLLVVNHLFPQTVETASHAFSNILTWAVDVGTDVRCRAERMYLALIECPARFKKPADPQRPCPWPVSGRGRKRFVYSACIDYEPIESVEPHERWSGLQGALNIRGLATVA